MTTLLKITSIGQPKETAATRLDGKGKARKAWFMFSAPSTKLMVDPETGEEVKVIGQPKNAGQSLFLDSFKSASDKDIQASYLATAKVGDRVEGTILTLPVDPHYRGADRVEGERVYHTSNFVFLGPEAPTQEQKDKAVESFNADQVYLQRVADLVTI